MKVYVSYKCPTFGFLPCFFLHSVAFALYCIRGASLILFSLVHLPYIYTPHKNIHSVNTKQYKSVS